MMATKPNKHSKFSDVAAAVVVIMFWLLLYIPVIALSLGVAYRFFMWASGLG